MENAGTGMVRLVDELGRIVLPIELRRKLGIHEGDPIEFFFDTSNNRIMLRNIARMNVFFAFQLIIFLILKNGLYVKAA